jgi:hypothetical protein
VVIISILYLEEVGAAIGPSESGVNVARQVFPIRPDATRITRSYGFGFQFPILFTCYCIIII